MAGVMCLEFIIFLLSNKHTLSLRRYSLTAKWWILAVLPSRFIAFLCFSGQSVDVCLSAFVFIVLLILLFLHFFSLSLSVYSPLCSVQNSFVWLRGLYADTLLLLQLCGSGRESFLPCKMLQILSPTNTAGTKLHMRSDG